MKENRSLVSIKISSLQRYLIWNNWFKKIDYIFISEYPKSGATWFCQMLSELIDTPFPRNKIAPFTSCIIHSHLSPLNNHVKPILIVRDGRDIMVSAYYHFLLSKDSPMSLINQWRKKMPFSDFENVKLNMKSFINIFQNNYFVGGKIKSWNQHIEESLANERILIIKYEDLLLDASLQLKLACEHLGRAFDLQKAAEVIEKFSFVNQQTQFSAMQKDHSFLRKGISGDWKNNFNEETSKTFDSWGGNTLIRLGYEKNHNWF